MWWESVDYKDLICFQNTYMMRGLQVTAKKRQKYAFLPSFAEDVNRFAAGENLRYAVLIYAVLAVTIADFSRRK